MAKLRKAVHYYPDGIEPVTLRKSYHEVHTQVLPGRIRDGVGLEGAKGGLLGSLGTSTRETVSDILVQVFPDSGPEKGSGCQFQCLCSPGMSGCGDVVRLLQDV